ncbi:pirin family protein [Vibrio harveyi]|uniref:pirin family protein n=1 Tax=Vibrio harveyi TaxID=669 RepID=UPI001C97653B|nr:pirin family protein [Vibrio harveyi]MBY6236860.1 pirin family protein [Vibrio harveyi]
MIEIRRSQGRGVNDWGWLYSRNTFSVGNYYDPQHMGFSSLRVFNDDVVAPGKGFATHSHKNMEIISLVLEGVIEHEDNQGNIKRLVEGEYQLMSAGKGISHSEYNGLQSDSLRFMQIWIEPSELGGKPSYQQQAFDNTSGLTPIVTPTGENGTLRIKQDATMYQLIVEPGEHISLPLSRERRGFVHVLSGQLTLNEQGIGAGDGAKVSSEANLSFTNPSGEKATALVFDLP